jgi:cysteine-rich repeat protein
LNTCIIATCGDGYLRDGEEECDDNDLTDGDGCSSVCETEYCRDDAPFNAKDASFVVTTSDSGTVVGSSSYPNVKIALCYQESDGTKNHYYTTTDA